MAQYEFNCRLQCSTYGEATLPEGKEIHEIKSSTIKWGKLFIHYYDGDTSEHELALDSPEVDWEYPTHVEVFQIDPETLEVDYSTDFVEEFKL